MRKWRGSPGRTRSALAAVAAAVLMLLGFMALPGPAAGAAWSEPVMLARGTYNSLGIALTDDNAYMASWQYGTSAYGGVFLFASADDGATWSRTDVFGTAVRDGHPNMCAFSNSLGTDTVIVASAPGKVAMSTDSGQTFPFLTGLPLGMPDMSSGYPRYWSHWMYMAVGTNASWTGGAADGDIYVFGARVLDNYFSGLLYLSMTVSHDGGMTWTEPSTICPFTAYYPEVTRDGDDLYVVFNALWGENHADLFAMKSSDWGVSWSEPKLVLVKYFADGGVNPCSFQNLGGGIGLVTVSDHHPTYSDNMGTWCTFSFADMSLKVVGRVAGEGWNVDLGFAGRIVDDGRMALGWLYFNYDYSSADLKFTYGTGTLSADPAALIQELIDLIEGWSLHPNINRGLVAKLYAALEYLYAGEMDEALEALERFISLVSAQEGKALTSYWADYLRDHATEIMVLIQSG